MENRMFDFENFYSRIAKQMPQECRCVEVGVADGDSAIYFAQALYELGKTFTLYMVDNMDYGGYSQMNTLWRNVSLSGLTNFIEVVPMDSIEASKQFNGNSLDFIFLDSSHKYEETKREIVSWYDKLKDGGILAGHDYYSEENKGVGKAVDEMIPKKIKRRAITEKGAEQEFEPEQLLFTEETERGNGVWYLTKRFYWKPKIKK